MESIRIALGQQQINYYGFSYGTYLGQVYATLYPTHLRRAVLRQQRRPHAGSGTTRNLDQDVGLPRDITAFFTWVANYDSHYHLGTTESAVEALYYGDLDQLRRNPRRRPGRSRRVERHLPAGRLLPADLARRRRPLAAA